jgi:RNA polymerase sigma factor (sigma-70 family)
MTEHELESFPSAQLFQHCAEHLDKGEYWAEFVRRYNQILARAVYHAYRRFAPAALSQREVVADAMQDIYQEIYLELLQDNCQALRHFHGQTAAEAEAYLAHIAIHITVTHLRRSHALKRQNETIQLDDLLQDDEEPDRQSELQSDPPAKLSESELIDLLRHTFTGPNSQRDILLLLLHLREGLTARELAACGFYGLKAPSIANILIRMKAKLKKQFSE